MNSGSAYAGTIFVCTCGLYIRLSVEDNKKRGCSAENQKLVMNDFLSDKTEFVVYDITSAIKNSLNSRILEYILISYV